MVVRGGREECLGTRDTLLWKRALSCKQGARVRANEAGAREPCMQAGEIHIPQNGRRLGGSAAWREIQSAAHVNLTSAGLFSLPLGKGTHNVYPATAQMRHEEGERAGLWATGSRSQKALRPYAEWPLLDTVRYGMTRCDSVMESSPSPRSDAPPPGAPAATSAKALSM